MLRRFVLAFIAVTLLAAPAFAQTKSQFSTAQKAEIESIIKQYIADNPETMISSVEAYYNKQAATKQKQEGRLEQVPAGLYDYPLTPYVGPKDAKLVVVEFFDYNCGYCKQVAGDLLRLVNEEKGSVKFMFKELPILSETSKTAAQYALAANKQGKYLEYHQALMDHQGPINETLLQDKAKEVGLDVEKLKKDAMSGDVNDALMKNVELARVLGIRGTPFFLIGKEKVPGALGYTQMKETLNRERGVAPAAAAPAAATTTTTSSTSQDPDVQAEIEKARAETTQMINDIKKQADDMQKAAQAAAAAEAAKKKQ